MDLRWIVAAAFAAALAPIYGASASQTTPVGAFGDLSARVDEAQVSSAGSGLVTAPDRVRDRAFARLSQARRATVRLHASADTVRPLEAGFSRSRCGGQAPNPLSGFLLVRSDTTGQVHLGDFFPSLNRAASAATHWSVGIRNVTFERQDWFSGVVCSQMRVRYRLFTSAVEPFASDVGAIRCPRGAPNAVSGFFVVVSDTTGDIQVGDFFPVLRGRRENARPSGWVIGVRNLTDQRQEWRGGVVCTRSTVLFSTGSGRVEPMGTLIGRARCPASAPNGVSGLSLVMSETEGESYETGQLQLGDFFPVLSGRRPDSRGWVAGVKNLTDQPQEWIWGAMCMR